MYGPPSQHQGELDVAWVAGRFVSRQNTVPILDQYVDRCHGPARGQQCRVRLHRLVQVRRVACAPELLAQALRVLSGVAGRLGVLGPMDVVAYASSPLMPDAASGVSGQSAQRSWSSQLSRPSSFG